MFSSIRHGLFAALAGFTILICLAYTALALVISYVTEDMLVDRLLEREAAGMSAHFRAHGEIKLPASDFIRAYRSVDALPPAVREPVVAGRERAEISTGTGQHYHLRALNLPSQKIYLLADVQPLLVVSKLFQEVGGFLTAVAFGLIALALLLAYWLSRRLVSPLLVLADEVRSQTPAFSAAHRRDEIGYLAQKLDTTISELQASLDREHAFTRDVSHELRTPLTVMNNALAVQDLAQLQAGLAEIGNTVDVLFALARAEHVAQEVVDLRGCIEDSLLRLMTDDVQLTLELPERLPVLGNRHLIALLVNNCLGNALFHGGPACRLALSFDDGVLSIGNTVNRAATMQGFQHGQNLLQRIATAMRWEISFHAGDMAYRVDIVPRQ
ncbi:MULTISPECIES: HAMP domain-containing sensor histidine kinase [unclassified Duganella]|uniref:sensor histidine kinase n=1 Tax=unclassified Duganella TaxID=2636909 RepID=UPI000887F3EC|nr:MULTISPECIES: HAMP domain-containing histidine kinase [unclassified Duganella]SDF95139.1 Signal transduction histidine kinase [Duganella sp. OV458]SDJ09566.1 Signal transduction histidine kinase [Duganella sp. OV510]